MCQQKQKWKPGSSVESPFRVCSAPGQIKSCVPTASCHTALACLEAAPKKHPHREETLAAG